MFVAPGTVPDFGRRLSREAAERVARNWWLLLFDGVLLIVAGFLLFSIDWTIRSLATFFGVVFILEGVAEALTSGIAARVRRANVITGLLSVGGIWVVAVGVLRIVLAFEIKRISEAVDRAWAAPTNDGASSRAKSDQGRPVARS
jgi:uncharacterized membrane protein HdeD (DUF308 family)